MRDNAALLVKRFEGHKPIVESWNEFLKEAPTDDEDALGEVRSQIDSLLTVF
jgi:hypothetical protein